ncbi:MAG: NAD(P)H-quinone oxidoreductase [Propionibacteriaceae bacterium]|nr:NAD(P)H-quinone oxidoreductase [Propionibacteriaceae bacterium]
MKLTSIVRSGWIATIGVSFSLHESGTGGMLEHMKAVIVRRPGGPEELALSDVSTPEPGEGEVKIAVRAAGVNRADLLQRQGHYPPPPGVTEILGLEVAGVVESIGRPTGESWVPRIGAPVVALLAGGGYSEHVVAPMGQCAPLPLGLSKRRDAASPVIRTTASPTGLASPVDPAPLAEPASPTRGDFTSPTNPSSPSASDLVIAGGIMETAATVVSNFDHIHVQAGETILIHGGAGGIGSFAIPYAKQLGLRVITTVGSPHKAEQARTIGADVVLDYHEDWSDQAKHATQGRGVDAILDIIGAKYLEANVALLARGGRMTVIGLQGGTKATLNLGLLLSKGATVTATSLRFRPPNEKTSIVRRVVAEVWPLFTSGAIPLPHLTTFPLAQARLAHELLESGRNIGKIVLTVG